MTDAEYHDALKLLDSAAALLQRRDFSSRGELLRELRRLTLALDLLRLRVGQAPAETKRN